MRSSRPNVITLRPRAWSATARSDTAARGSADFAEHPAWTGQLARCLAPQSDRCETAVDRELEKEAALFRDLFERSPVGVLVMDLQGRIQRANAMASAILGRDVSALRGQSLARLCLPGSLPQLHRHLDLLASGECFDACELELLGPGHAALPMHVATLNVGEGTDGPLRAALFDASGLQELEDGLALAASVVEHTTQGIVVTDASHRVVAVNPAFTGITGFRADEMLGQVPDVFRGGGDPQISDPTMADRLRRFGHWHGEVWSRRRSGETFTQWVIIDAIQDQRGAVTHYVCMVSDMTTQEDAKQELRKLAYTDSLTGLANRISLLEQLSRTLVSARREKRLVGLLYLDLDHFKDVNDSLGHSAGDRLLQFVAEQLRGAVRQTDLVARLGGDEFTILVPDLKRDQSAGQIAANILRRLAENPFRHEDREIRLGASIGIALFPRDAIDSEGLLACADAAMYEAKRGGRSGFRFHTAAIWTRYREGNALEEDLRHALDREELVLLYQPQVALGGFQIVGCEALMQWWRSRREPVDAGLFSSLAQKTELIVPFQHWALRRIADQTAAWRTKLDRLRVSVDISTVQLRTSHLEQLLEHLREYLDGRGCGLELELDEGSLMDCQEQALNACDRVRNLTLPIALDHFGSGLSSLTHIRRLPLTRLKLAGILIRDVESDAGAAAVVSAIVALGHGLGLKVLAQDVETPGQLAFLREIGCDEAQGSLFSPPLTAEKFAELLERISHMGPGPKGPDLPPGLSSRARPGFVGALCGALRRGRAGLTRLASRRRPA